MNEIRNIPTDFILAQCPDNLKDVPIDFILSQMPENQQKMMLDKWHIYTFMKSYHGNKTEAYIILSEKLCKDPETIRKIWVTVGKMR